MTLKHGTQLAALDLGSNSFRLEISIYDGTSVRQHAYYKEAVHQGAGLDNNNNLNEAAMERGWACLARFAERLVGFKHEQVRAVATQTLREAQNSNVFLDKAHKILGFPIDVVSGYEEARLIYQGVAHTLPQSNERRLVIDIGGRSTELILGQAFEARTMQSYQLGASSWNMTYFKEGALTQAAFHQAQVAAMAVLDEIGSIFSKQSWDIAYGSSGTMGAVADVLNIAGLGIEHSDTVKTMNLLPSQLMALDLGDGVITRQGVLWLKEQLLEFKHIDKIQLEGLKDDRRLVIAGGVSIVLALFDLLNIDWMIAAQGALRHGAVYDLIDRSELERDVRLASIKRLAHSFQVDKQQSERVGQLAHHLLSRCGHTLLKHGFLTSLEPILKKLNWATQLHEVGRLISHDDYHKHGAYIVTHAQVSGFALHELSRLSALILGQQGKLKKIGVLLNDPIFVMQLLCLRLAVLLCHARSEIHQSVFEGLQLTVDISNNNNNDTTVISFKFILNYPDKWQDTLPQTVFLLEQECEIWDKTDHFFILNSMV